MCSAFAQAYPQTVDEIFNKHWYLSPFVLCLYIMLIHCCRTTWFTQDDINQLVAAGINTVRVPVGWRSSLRLIFGLQRLCGLVIGLLRLWWPATMNSSLVVDSVNWSGIEPICTLTSHIVY